MKWYDKLLGRDGSDTKASKPINSTESNAVENTPEPIKEVVVDTPEGKMPVSAGRSSEPDFGRRGLSGLYSDGIIQPEFHVELLRALEYLAKYNPDISYALDNIVQLGNTRYDIYFSSDLSPEEEQEMLEEIRRVEKIWYTNSGGIMSLRNDLFAQLVLTGAISAERVPTNNLDGIGKVVLVNPVSVRFSYNSVEDTFEPYQIGTLLTNKVSTSKLGMNPLNPITYKYLALRKFNESPYAIPPFLSALENSNIERYMVDNFSVMVKKLGVMGFLSVLVNQPSKSVNQSDDEYIRAVNTYLDEVAREVDKGLNKGYVVGYKNSHQFKMESVNTNVSGVRDLFRLNSEMKMAGLKQDPLMLGRNYSTTETVGRVILAKLGSQIKNYQDMVDQFLADTMYLHLLLKGHTKLKYVQVESQKSLVGDEQREQEAYSKKIDNARKLYEDGIISQTQRAQMLGYDKAELPEPRPQPVTGPTNPGTTDPNNPTPELGPDAVDPQTTDYARGILEVSKRLGSDIEEFNYDWGHGDSCGAGCHHQERLSVGRFSRESQFDGLVKNYAKSVGISYGKAVDKVAQQVLIGLRNLPVGSGPDTVVDNVIYNMFTGMEKHFKFNVQNTVKSYIQDIYAFYRKDKSIFGSLADNIPNATYNLKDFRTMTYYQNSDNLYLGKFITDESTKKKVAEFIRNKYVGEGIPIGNDPLNINTFRAEFTDLLAGEDWKIVRIVNTTVNKMRNTAALNYMSQAEVIKFSIVGISDKHQCAYCAALNGKTFDVAYAVERITEVENVAPEMVKVASPFITSKQVNLSPEDLKRMTEAEIQAKAGGAYPPFHGSCRCQAVASI